MTFSLRACLLFITFLAASSIASAKSGPILSGSAKEPFGTTIEFATVVLHRATDSVVVKTEFSDATGSFRFDQLPAGRYFVSASIVGFERTQTAPFFISTADQALPPIQLKPSGNINLNEVTLQARKPLFEREADRIVVNVDGNPLSAGGFCNITGNDSNRKTSLNEFVRSGLVKHACCPNNGNVQEMVGGWIVQEKACS